MEFTGPDDLIALADTLIARTTDRIATIPHAEPAASGTPSGLVPVADVPARPLTWLWDDWIPNGALTVLGGHAGDGKSTLVAHLAAAFSTASELPDGQTARRANTLILSAEDDPASVLRPRLAAGGADLDRVFIHDAADRPLDLHRDIAHLRELVAAHDIGLLVLDPLGAWLRRSERAAEGDVRAALHPLLTLLAETGIAALGVMRIGKAAPNRRPAQQLVGSSAVPAIARSVIMIAPAPADAYDSDDLDAGPPTCAILQVVKGNYACAPQPVAVHLDPTGAVHHLGLATAGINELAARARVTDPRALRSDRDEARDFLREYLGGADQPAARVLAQAKDLGFSEITIRRAKRDLGITSYRDHDDFGRWTWRLPPTER